MDTKKILFIIILIGGFLVSYHYYLRPVEGNPLITEEYRKSSAYVNDLYYSDEYFKKKLLNPAYYYIYEAIINNNKNFVYDVSIPCAGSNCSQIYNNAISAILLDHPELISFKGFGATYYNNIISYQDYSNLGEFKTKLGTRRIIREIDNIRKETANMSDKDKIIYVYNYVGSHEYDYVFMYNRSNQSAYSFFTKGKTVCAGFAKASQIILQNIGIKSYLAEGSNHMWNYVEYEGKYYVFDATVGACYDKTNPKYYDGLGHTTVGVTYGNYKDYYPKIESTPLKKVFNL